MMMSKVSLYLLRLIFLSESIRVGRFKKSLVLLLPSIEPSFGLVMSEKGMERLTVDSLLLLLLPLLLLLIPWTEPVAEGADEAGGGEKASLFNW